MRPEAVDFSDEGCYTCRTYFELPARTNHVVCDFLAVFVLFYSDEVVLAHEALEVVRELFGPGGPGYYVCAAEVALEFLFREGAAVQRDEGDYEAIQCCVGAF